MTRKDYSDIQRALGYIEGVLLGLDDDKGALDCINEIDLILDKEELEEAGKE